MFSNLLYSSSVILIISFNVNFGLTIQEDVENHSPHCVTL